MPQLVDLRPPGLNFRFRPGDTYAVRLSGPAGWLTSRAFTATLGGTALTVTEDGDVLELAVPSSLTEDFSTIVPFVLTEVGGNDVLIGQWQPSLNASDSAVLDIDLTLGTIEVDVTLNVGAGGGGGGGAPSGPAGGVLGGTYPDPSFAVDMATQAELNAEAALARNADNLTSGTVADARIPSTIARDSEVTAAVLAETNARVADVDAEEAARIAGDAALDTRVDALELAPPAHAASHADGGSDEIAISGEQVTSGTVADARIAATITRDSELTAAVLVETNRATAAEALLAPLASPTFTGNPQAPTPSSSDNDTSIATTAMVQAAIAAYLAAQNVQTFKGTLDASGNPNYPAADAGHTYVFSVAGKIGGGSGPNVQVGDQILCLVDGSASGNHATVGANWAILQANIDGAVTGPASATDLRVAVFSGTSGKVIADGGVLLAALAPLASPTFSGVVTAEDLTVDTVTAEDGEVTDELIVRGHIAVGDDSGNPNGWITSETNPSVEGIQIGLDGSGTLKEQHLSTSDQLGTGAGANMVINPGMSAGTNQAGATMGIAGGSSTGSGWGGGIYFLTAHAGASGDDNNPFEVRWLFDPYGNFHPLADNTYWIGQDAQRPAKLWVHDIDANGVIEVADEAYDATGWNGDLTVPTKNAVRDKIESLGVLSDGDKGDIVVSSSGAVWTVENDAVTFGKLQNIATDRLLGRDTASSGDAEEITVGGGVEFTGSGGIQTSAFTGDVTKSAGGTALTIGTAAVTLAKMADIATDRLLGRDTAGTGVPEALTVGGGIEFTGSGGIQRSAFAGGDVTASAGSASLTIANDAVTNAKAANMAQATIKGRQAGAGTGDPEDLTPAQARTAMGLGTAAVVDTGTSGANVPTVTQADARYLKRAPLVTTITSSGTPTVNTDSTDFVDITALAAAITNASTNLSGTPSNGQRLVYRIKDNGTARAITWGTSFEAVGVALPTTTVISKRLTVGFIYDSTTSKWGCVAAVTEA